MRNKIVMICVIMAIVGCDFSSRQYKFIETNRGLYPTERGYCVIGMLTSNNGMNIVDEDSKPITCTKTISLTLDEAHKRGYTE